MNIFKLVARVVGSVLFFLLVLPIVLLWLLLWALVWILLTVAVWVFWLPQGKNTLFVFSESPNWHDHIQENFLPEITERSVVLNWTKRREWQAIPSLSNLVFKFFGGSRDFNPMAIVFKPFQKPRAFRFFLPYRDFKHGKTESLETLSEEFFSYLDR